MLIDVEFPVFFPSKEWSQVFKESGYKTDVATEKCGSPFVSNQQLKVCDGVYYTRMNPENWFREIDLDVYPMYSNVYEKARQVWDERQAKGLKFISMFEIAEMYKIAMFGDAQHVEYGVCDNPQQILDKWSHLQKGSQRHFITMTPIFKKNQPSRGGWRWHKWGEYIGEHEIQCEYLYDEKDIEKVYIFHIHTLTPESGLGGMLEKQEVQQGEMLTVE